MKVTHWRTQDNRKMLIEDMTEEHKANVAAMVSKKYGFRQKQDNESLQEYLGQMLLWLECEDWCKRSSENYNQN